MAHHGLQITDEAFDKTVEYLGQALKKYGMSNDHITAVAMKLGGLKKDIVEIQKKPVSRCCC